MLSVFPTSLPLTETVATVSRPKKDPNQTSYVTGDVSPIF
jgi:hypothetical protein